MQTVESFLTALSCAHGDDARIVTRTDASGARRRVNVASLHGLPFSLAGCFVYHTVSGGVSLKCVMLDPGIHFQDVVDEARSVIVAGGTMQPVRRPGAPRCGFLGSYM